MPHSSATEAIVNACVHRSYTSNASVQVMLFRDRLEIWSPGSLPYGMTVEKMTKTHKSYPVNPLLAHPVYLTGYIERLGTGTLDMVDRCVAKGLKAPEFHFDDEGQVIIWRKNVTPNVAQSVTENQSVSENVAQNVAQSLSKKDDRIKRVLTSLISTPTVSQEEIAGILGVTRRTINRDLDILRQSYTIEWVGSPKTGYWKVEHK